MKVLRKYNRTIITPEMMRVIEQKIKGGNFELIQLYSYYKNQKEA